MCLKTHMDILPPFSFWAAVPKPPWLLWPTLFLNLYPELSVICLFFVFLVPTFSLTYHGQGVATSLLRLCFSPCLRKTSIRHFGAMLGTVIPILILKEAGLMKQGGMQPCQEEPCLVVEQWYYFWGHSDFPGRYNEINNKLRMNLGRGSCEPPPDTGNTGGSSSPCAAAESQERMWSAGQGMWLVGIWSNMHIQSSVSVILRKDAACCPLSDWQIKTEKKSCSALPLPLLHSPHQTGDTQGEISRGEMLCPPVALGFILQIGHSCHTTCFTTRFRRNQSLATRFSMK